MVIEMKQKPILINKNEIVENSEKIYAEIKEKLLPEYKGKIAAIEVDSGDYFIGESIIEAGEKAKEKFPNKFFHFVRIGYAATYVRR